MKKKVIACVLASMMALTLGACGSSSSNQEGESASAAASTSADSQGSDAQVKDLDQIKKNGKLVIGITDFEPMDYKDDNGEWIGFDADLAKKVGEDLGVDVEFQEIDWDNKILELDNGSIDCVWNGMTLTDEVKKSMAVTQPYCNNAQVVIVPKDKADQYKDLDSIKDLTFAVESGSAGEEAATENDLNYTAVTAQSDTLLEVKSGSSDAAIIDLLMASAMTGEGTSYSDLTHTIELTTEEYGVGCRKGSDLRDYLNEEFTKFYQDGTMKEIAGKYNLTDVLIEQ
jgi:polar amino acid transport system substrate-binding protein